jgi:hypothetical protein
VGSGAVGKRILIRLTAEDGEGNVKQIKQRLFVPAP